MGVFVVDGNVFCSLKTTYREHMHIKTERKLNAGKDHVNRIAKIENANSPSLRRLSAKLRKDQLCQASAAWKVLIASRDRSRDVKANHKERTPEMLVRSPLGAGVRTRYDTIDVKSSEAEYLEGPSNLEWPKTTQATKSVARSSYVSETSLIRYPPNGIRDLVSLE